MPPAWQRIAPFILTGILLFNLAAAIVEGGQARWLMVALLALLLAFAIWRRRRAEP